MKSPFPFLASVGVNFAWFVCATGLLAAPPPACEWVFPGPGGGQGKTRAVAFDRGGNAFLAAEFAGEGTFGTLRRPNAGGLDMCLVKLDAAGRPLWVSGLGGSLTERAYGVATDAAGNAYVTGHFESTNVLAGDRPLPHAGNFDAFTAKFSPDGKLLWARTAGGAGSDYGHAIAVDARGDVIVTGAVQGPAKFGEQTVNSHGKGGTFFCAKYAPDGQLHWVRTPTGNVGGSGHGVAVDGAGHIYVGGSVSGTGAWGTLALESKTTGALALKLSPVGDAVWASIVPGTTSAIYHEIACDDAGRVWGAGMFKGAVSVAGEHFQSAGEKDYDGFMVHLDRSGRPQWARTLRGPGTDYCLGVATDGRGTSFVCGDFTADTALAGQPLKTRGSGDIFLAAFDPVGALLWVQQAGGKGNDSAYPLVFRAPDQLLMGGSFGAGALFDAHTPAGAGNGILYGAKWRLVPAKVP